MAKIVGAHSIIYSKDAAADRAFLRDVVGLRSVDAGGGWLIFALPPAEVAVHPADTNNAHELYLMVDDVAAFVKAMSARGIACSATQDLRWGALTQLTLPSGGTLGVYQPYHVRPTEPKRRSKSGRPPSRKTKSTRAGRRRARG